MTASPSFLDRLRAECPALKLSQDPSDLTEYGRDWTRAVDPAPLAIAFPATTEEVSKIMKLASATGTAIVPSGGRTGLSGGAVAASGELVLSLARMNRMHSVDPLSQTVRVQAGAITEAVHQHCEPHGLTWPVDFASKGSSHVGGNLATNAGGVRVIRYGLTRNWVLGLQVVLAGGEILEINGELEKNQTGLDLRQLFIGSEGTLGIITEATLKLTRLPPPTDVLFFGVDGLDGVLGLFREARRQPFTIQAFEMLGANCLQKVIEHRSARPPLSTPASDYVLLEVERPASEAGQQELQTWLESLFERGLVQDGTLAQSPEEACALWSLREGISESIMSAGLVHKQDVSVPIRELQGFCSRFERELGEKYPGHTLYLFGHIGDGNLHINIAKPEGLERDAFYARCKQIDEDLFRLLQAHQGSVSGEHGVGLLKKYALSFSRSPAEIATMRAVKQALDPKGILNPGKIL